MEIRVFEVLGKSYSNLGGNQFLGIEDREVRLWDNLKFGKSLEKSLYLLLLGCGSVELGCF